MEAVYVLALLICMGGILAYYVLYGLCKLVENLMKNSGQSLKSIMILVTLVGLVWVLTQRNNADQILNDLKERVMSGHALVSIDEDLWGQS